MVRVLTFHIHFQRPHVPVANEIDRQTFVNSSIFSLNIVDRQLDRLNARKCSSPVVSLEKTNSDRSNISIGQRRGIGFHPLDLGRR